MTGLADITLLRPLWLLAVPGFAALAVVWLRRGGQLGDWRARIDPHLMAAMESFGRIERGTTRSLGWLPFAAAVLVAIALAGPAVPRRDAQTFRNLDGVIFVIDVSGSMARDPVWPKVVTMARAGLSALSSQPAALIVFAGDSYLASPLTTDRLQLGQTMSLLGPDTVPDRGNRPALALAQAAEILAETRLLSADVVLMSDGAGIGPAALDAARAIAARGGRLSVVQAETAAPGGAPDALAAVAAAGKGRLYGVDETAAIMADLGRRDDPRLERQELRLLLLRDYGRAVLLLAMLPALLLFRRAAA